VQDPGVTTPESRCNSFGLIYSLNSQGPGTGKLYIDDGESIQINDFITITFTANKNRLTAIPVITGDMENIRNALGCSEANFLTMNNLEILGVESDIVQVYAEVKRTDDWDDHRPLTSFLGGTGP